MENTLIEFVFGTALIAWGLYLFRRREARMRAYVGLLGDVGSQMMKTWFFTGRAVMALVMGSLILVHALIVLIVA